MLVFQISGPKGVFVDAGILVPSSPLRGRLEASPYPARRQSSVYCINILFCYPSHCFFLATPPALIPHHCILYFIHQQPNILVIRYLHYSSLSSACTYVVPRSPIVLVALALILIFPYCIVPYSLYRLRATKD